MVKKELEQIESEGYVAGGTGAPREHNPHQHGSAEWAAWNDGWMEADYRHNFDYRYESHNSRDDVMGCMSAITFFILVVVGACVYKAVTWLFA